MARPHDGTWADYVAVFRKATDQPFERKGRIADHTTAMNIFDGAKLDPMQLDAERAETWDMLDAARARAEAGQAQAELDQTRSQAAELLAQVAALTERSAQLERSVLDMEARVARVSPHAHAGTARRRGRRQ